MSFARQQLDRVRPGAQSPSVKETSPAPFLENNDLWWSNKQKRFKGTWDDRLDGLFSAEVDYAGKSILDVGCNMGVVAYEISKLGPSSIHGIDILKPHIETAKMIFLGCPVQSRFDCLDLGSRKLQNVLQPQYDIVMLLAVYHHMQWSLGEDKARRVLCDIAGRAQTIVARVPPGKDKEMIAVLSDVGFSIKSNHTSPLGSHLMVLAKH
ncbi:class I SAM-dependent methyltransferase [Mesorhizobium sp. M0598]|uniref:class I SAM-dependent methyltransferase n=1 Tax=Mesorhizobium sp. M0598 TaxID=2956968 RepID=UPI00333C484B